MELFEAIDQSAVPPFKVIQMDWLTSALRVITRAGDTPIVLAAAALGILWFAVKGRFGAAGLLAVAAAAGLGLTYLGKAVVDRPRPNTRWSPIATPQSSSFPSGHALNAAAVYGTFALLASRGKPRGSRAWLVGIAALAAFLVGFSRLYLGVNYVSDVVAGWAAGAALAMGCGLAGAARSEEVPRKADG